MNSMPMPDEFPCAEDYYVALDAHYANQLDVAEWGDVIAA